MSDSMGCLISEYVHERTVAPRSGDVDTWIEEITAGLFIVGVSLIMLSNKTLASPEAMEQELNNFCSEAATHANHWINDFLQPKGIKALFRRSSIACDFTELITGRLAAYLTIYFDLMEKQNLPHKSARWEALITGLPYVAERLCSTGIMRKFQEPKWVEDIIAKCRYLVNDLPVYAR